MTTVVRFQKRPAVSAEPSLVSFELDQKAIVTDAVRLERVTSACATLMNSIESLQQSLATLDKQQYACLADDHEPIEAQSTSISSQISLRLACIAGILHTLGDAAEQVSRIDLSFSRPDHVQRQAVT